MRMSPQVIEEEFVFISSAAVTSAKKRDLKRMAKQSDGTTKWTWTKWTPDEHDRFLDALEKEGKDWKKITEAVGTKDRDQITNYGSKLTKKFRQNPSLKGAHLLEILEAKAVNFWTEEEKENFLEALETHGKNWTKIMDCVGTKTRQEIIGYGYSLAARIKKDPSLKGAHLL